MGVVISINGGPADALLMMSPQQFAAMAAAMELHPSRGGARCEICARRPDDEFALVDVGGVEQWLCEACNFQFADCPLCDVSHGGRPCPVDAD